MKRFLLMAGLACLGTQTGHTQWAVFDAAALQQQISSTAQEIAKFVEVTRNQIDQLRSLQDQAATLHHYVDLFGNPAAIIPAAIPALTRDLTRPEVGAVLGALVRAADPKAAMASDGGGLYLPIGQAFTTPEGVAMGRDVSLYRPTAAVQNTVANYQTVSTDTATRRVALKAEIARTAAALSAARTDAEVQKLTGALVGLGAALQGTESELGAASASALVQDVANRADAHRQEEARKEEQAAQFAEAVQNYGRTFKLLSAPVAFPTR